jgi:hydroxyacylglutathione hydrolase
MEILQKNLARVAPIRVVQEPMINYSYIIYSVDSNKCILIDPSFEEDKIVKVMNERELTPSTVLITHSHFDHIHSLEFFINYANPEVWISETEASYYQFKSRNLQTFKHMQGIVHEGLNIMAFVTPGHTKGSSCFMIQNNLFTGDTLFTEGCGACTAPGGNAVDMFNSLQMLKHITNLHSKIYPAHSFGMEPGLPYKEVQKMNIYLELNNEGDFIQFRNRKNQKTNPAFY